MKYKTSCIYSHPLLKDDDVYSSTKQSSGDNILSKSNKQDYPYCLICYIECKVNVLECYNMSINTQQQCCALNLERMQV